MTFFQIYSTTVYSFYHGIKSVNDTDVWCLLHFSSFSDDRIIFHIMVTMEFKYFQGPLILNSKTFKHQTHFQGLSRALKNGKNFKILQGFSRKCGHPVQGTRMHRKRNDRVTETGFRARLSFFIKAKFHYCDQDLSKKPKTKSKTSLCAENLRPATCSKTWS